jgi:hypothetical protein
VCDPGFTGHICDKNLTEIELKNGKVNGNGNGKHETSSTASPANKDTVNENSTHTKNSTENIKEKAKHAGSNKTVGTVSKNTPTTNKALVNGQLKNVSGTDKEAIKLPSTTTSKEHIANDSSVNKEIGNNKPMPTSKQKKSSSAKSKDPVPITTTSKPKDKVLANGDINPNFLNTKYDTSDNSNTQNNANDNIKNQGKKFNGKANYVGDGIKSSVHKDKENKQPTSSIGNIETISKMPSDGSYIKGPESHVPTEHSAVDFSAKRSEIYNGKPSVVKEQTDVVTISSTSIEQKQLGRAPEMLTSGARDSLKTNKIKMSGIKIEHMDSKEKKVNPKIYDRKASLKSSSKKTTKSKALLNETVKNRSPLSIVSSVDIVDRNSNTVTEDTGSISLLKNTVAEVEVSPLLDSSEIKITIETSNSDFARRNKTAIKDNVLKMSTTSSGLKGQETNTEKNVANKNANTAFAAKDIQKQTHLENKVVFSKTVETAVNGEKSATNLGRNTNPNKPSKRVGASQNSETRKSTQSEILNPIMQLMNIFRSEKFVKNVSAVKIEIITKQNKTDDQLSPQIKHTEQINTSVGGKKPSQP